MRKARVPVPPLAITLVIAAALYTAALCFLNTRGLGVSNTTVAIVDGAILLSALALALRGASRWLWVLLVVLALNFLMLTLLSDRFEPKSVRDPLVLIAFGALGWRYGTFERAKRAFFIVAAIVLSVGLVEFLAPGAYIEVFNVIRFYAARGTVDADTMARLDTAFFISGARDGARMILPILGPHRVSSIFLEPVSMGNFGALALVFALALEKAHWRAAVAAGVVGVTAIVLADARFASMVVAFFVLARFIPMAWTNVAVAVMPFAALALLIAFGMSGIGAGDDLPTRLAGSGRVLLDMSPAELFGLSPYQTTAFDAGYAYAMSGFGLLACIVLWAAFVLLPAPTREAARYKVLLAVYMCALLCISGSSLFALKTAALAFFILGALAGRQSAVVRDAPRFVRAPAGLPA